MTADLAYLASPALDGRAPGSPGDVAARSFIAERFACLGLATVGSMVGFEQPFTDQAGNHTANVLGQITGTKPGLAAESVLISCHTDHFGGGKLGANDNASGVAALLSIAQDLVNRGIKPDRTLLFAAFGAEETGFEGSEYFMTNPPPAFDTSKLVYNVNMDMVGSYTASKMLHALGSFDGTAGKTAVMAHTSEHPNLTLSFGDESSLSDNATFCSRGVPYLFFWTEDTECYHQTCDTSARVDYASLASIAPLVGAVSLELANSSSDLRKGIVATKDVCAGTP